LLISDDSVANGKFDRTRLTVPADGDIETIFYATTFKKNSRVLAIDRRDDGIG
jgi:hypothetical protein